MFGPYQPPIQIKRVLSLCAAIVLTGSAARADLVSPYGGETAPNFAEVELLDDRLRISLEIDRADYPFFVSRLPADAPLSARTGRTLHVAFDGAKAEPEIALIDVRPRKPRVSSASSKVPAPRRSSEVVFAVLDYPFAVQPASVRISPPLLDDGMPATSIGLLVEHLGVPVTDYRYLSQAETMLPNWQDPWFTVFENPNLTRHHKSPLMGFVSVEPREVRSEIILRLRDLETWAGLELGSQPTLSAVEMDDVKAQAAAFLSGRNPVRIDGQEAWPEAVAVSEISVGAEGLQVLEPRNGASRTTTLLGVVMSYPTPNLASQVSITWDLFPAGVDKVPFTLTDPAGATPATAYTSDPDVTWKNHLTTWKNPVTAPVQFANTKQVSLPLISIACLAAVLLALRWLAFGGPAVRTVAAALVGALFITGVFMFPNRKLVELPVFGSPNAEVAGAVTEGILRNTSAALLETTNDHFDASLVPFVSANYLPEVSAELRRGLSVTLPSGAQARTDAISDLEIEDVSPIPGRSGTQVLASWTAQVSGGHWGHAHRREIRYRALFDLSRQGSNWFLDGLTVLSANSTGGGA